MPQTKNYKRLQVFLLVLVFLVLCGRAYASTTATITVGGSEQQVSGNWDQGNITVTFNGFTETLHYAQFSSPASLASAMAAMFSRDYISRGLCAHAVGATVTFQLKGSATFTPLFVSGPTNSFQFTPSGWPSSGSIADTGIVSLTVNNTVVSTTTYGATSTPATVAAGLAANVAANSPVTVEANGYNLYVEAKTGGASTDYAYTLATTSFDNTDFAQSSFLSSPLSGNLDGGADQSSSGGTIYSYAPSYDKNGNVTGYSDSVMGSRQFYYDYLNRLSVANTPTPGTNGMDTCWSYDTYGNRTLTVVSAIAFPTNAGGETPCPIRSGDQPVQTTPNGNNQINSNTISYDAAGGITNDGRNLYLYDAEERVCAVQYPNAGTTVMVGYVYNAEGQRVSKGYITSWSCDISSNGFTPQSDYVLGPSGEQVSEVSVQPGGALAWQHTNVYANGQLLATYDDDGLHFHLSDDLGTRRVQTDYAGVVESSFVSYPFGEMPDSQPLGATEQHFTGQQHDTESGLDYFGARYYASSMGRWLSPDWSAKASPVPFATFGDPQSLNLYSYVRNNPLTNSDADGHCDIGCAFSIAWGVFQGIQRDGGVGNYSRNLGIGVLKGAGSAVVNTLKLAAAGTNPGAIAAAVLSPGPKALQPSNTTQAQASIATQIAGPAVVGMAAGPLLGAAGAGESAASGLPATVARAIPASIDATTLGAPGASDVFVTSGGALNGMTSSQISSGLTIPESSSGFNIFEFPTPDGIASPINRTNPGFVGGGQTAGGLPEYVVPNGPIPANATKTFVPPSQ